MIQSRPENKDLEYFQLRLYQLQNYLKTSNCYNHQEILNAIHWCEIKIGQRFLMEVELNKRTLWVQQLRKSIESGL